jgi:hypothetical protein
MMRHSGASALLMVGDGLWTRGIGVCESIGTRAMKDSDGFRVMTRALGPSETFCESS